MLKRKLNSNKPLECREHCKSRVTFENHCSEVALQKSLLYGTKFTRSTGGASMPRKDYQEYMNDLVMDHILYRSNTNVTTQNENDQIT